MEIDVLYLSVVFLKLKITPVLLPIAGPSSLIILAYAFSIHVSNLGGDSKLRFVKHVIKL